MTENPDEFITLDRTFHELTSSGDDGDDSTLRRWFGRQDKLHWGDLLAFPRVILLSEAGSGKTEEIRHVTRQLRSESKPAFFLRIENVVDDFDSSFEEGTAEEFQDWLRSGQSGWLFLDSVDEARLRNPKDFERAIRKIGTKLRLNLQNVHIVITGRTEAWRPKTDLVLCKAVLAWPRPLVRVEDGGSGADPDSISTASDDSVAAADDPFKIVALDDLQGEQLDRFATAKAITDLKAFRNAIERADAWSFTTRPQDLAETIEYWIENRRIGSRLDLMRNSIAKRLEERDQNRAESRPMTVAKAREGARLVAAAATLSRESAIRVPDGDQNRKGIAIKDVLNDWDDLDCVTLLSRPIFDEGIYGTVRFHHRSVREYLTAEWLQSLIVDVASRRKIEKLFFRRQYGIEVIVPTLRPILPWLAILDSRVLERVCRLAPEILFEGGDPSQLPLETRKEILRQCCEQLAQPAHGRSFADYQAVQRFASPDLADQIGSLLDRYASDEDIVWFLLRMVWQGEIGALKDKAKDFAISSRAKYARIAAIRAIFAIGSPDDKAEVRERFSTEAAPLNRDWLAELIEDLPRDSTGISWLLAVLDRAGPKERFSVDAFSKSLQTFVAELPLVNLPEFLNGVLPLLARAPVVERRYCEISRDFGWLAGVAAQGVIRLVEARNPAALDITALSILRRLPAANDYDHELRTEIRKDIPELVQAWPQLNCALFWYCIAETRDQLVREKGERLTDYWNAWPYGSYWGFRTDSFEPVVHDIETRPLLDDRLVALSLAFDLYRQGGRPRTQLARLKKVVSGNIELQAALDRRLVPPPRRREEWRKQETAWKKRKAAEAAREAKDLKDAKRQLAERVEQLRSPAQPGVLTNDQYYLHERMRASDDQHSRWTDGNWQSLIVDFGRPVAEAYRDGAVGFWRNYCPQLISEGGKSNSTPIGTIFALTGLAIESRETVGWPKNLSAADAELATRYALAELNGFPAWLPQLFSAFPTEVAKVILGEIMYELSVETEEGESNYVLHDVAWHGAWIWDEIAPSLILALRAKRINLRNLGSLLAIVQGSSVDDATIARLAAQKAKTTRNPTFAPTWFSVWIGVDPDAAILALTTRLAEIKEHGQQTNFASNLIVNLIGGRRQEGRARRNYRTVEHMKSLFLLMHRYVRQHEDIDRAGTGVYSPGLRDDAQDAREALFGFIRETPGKEAFLALMEMARAHPEEESRPWMSYHAKTKATADADISPWTPGEVREFNDSLVRTPRNHRELWYLAVDRLEALKYDLEDGDASIASILQAVDLETQFRKFIGGWCRDRAAGRYNIPQEEELADAKRPDLRFLGVGFDGPVPAELKVADKWTGPHLFERLEVQLCGDYLRDVRSSRGVFLLVYLGTKTSWELPGGGTAQTFDALIEALRSYWAQIATGYAGVEDIAIVGIDLTKRGLDTKSVKEATKQRKSAPVQKKKAPKKTS
ncbi:NACHT domain-containing protein (plasmid) [Rhizobium leguminosarum]